MQVRDIMSSEAVCCFPDAAVADAARLMVDHDCGEIPVCDRDGSLIGVITDRDIVCRTIARGDDPRRFAVEECMSTPVVAVTADTDVEHCARLMEEYQIRRVPVVDGDGACIAMVTQADLAIRGPRETTMEVVERVSAPSAFASDVGVR